MGNFGERLMGCIDFAAASGCVASPSGDPLAIDVRYMVERE